MATNTRPVPTLTEAILDLGQKVADPDYTAIPEAVLPGLPGLIQDWHSDAGVSQEDFFRRILGVFKDSTHSEHYENVLKQLPPSHREAIDGFVSGNKSLQDISHVGHEVKTKTGSAEKASIFSNIVPEFIRGHPRSDFEFKNWGQNITFTPALTYYPRNTAEIQKIVKQSIQNKQGIRVSGYRHSWAPIFGRNNKKAQNDNGDAMISMLSEHEAGQLPNFTALPSCCGEAPNTELSHIEFVDASFVHGQPLQDGRRYVRLGAATTNEQFRRWCVGPGQVTFPCNIIEVEITIGGANAPICHGAGIGNQTISDRVRCIEYVDAKGNLGKVDMSDPKLIKTAAGCFGLLGVVTHITFECDKISTAVLTPVKLDVMRAIPPPPGMPDSEIPEALRLQLTPEQRRQDQADFEHKANTDYYAEWFWFPYSSKIWANCWSTDSNTKDVVNFPSDIKTVFQVLGTIAGNIAQVLIGDLNGVQFLPKLQTTVMSWMAMKNMPDIGPNDKPIRTLLPNALHFQRGVTNMRVRDLEVEFPLHLKKGSQDRDFTNVQQAWWDAIISAYKAVETCPQRMPLEMRIMGDSQVTMAPQRGHVHGTCSIEILTLHDAADIWEPYANSVLDKWMSLKDANGNAIPVRPHWAKEWAAYKVNGKPWAETLKNEMYPEAIKEFKANLSEIVAKQGLQLGDLKRMYSNEMLDYLFFDDVEATQFPDTTGIHMITERGRDMIEAVKHRFEIVTEELLHI